MPSGSPARTAGVLRRLPRATRPSSMATSMLSGRSSKSMLKGEVSKVHAAPAATASAQYLHWLRRERRTRLIIRAAQVAILIVFLVLWEILPRAHLINPLFTSYPSAIWPTFLDMLKETPQQPGILTHTWATVLATVIGFVAAMVLGVAIAAMLWWWESLYKVLDPYLVVANAMPKTAFVPIFYIWLGATF